MPCVPKFDLMNEALHHAVHILQKLQLFCTTRIVCLVKFIWFWTQMLHQRLCFANCSHEHL